MSTNAIDTFKSLGLATTQDSSTKTANNNSLGQDAFLKLLTTQMTHQDPTKPMDGTAWLSQLAQFSATSGIQELQTSFKDFQNSMSSNQALQAATLVGKNVLAPNSLALLNAGGNVFGDFELPVSSSNVSVTFSDSRTGEVVKTIDFGSQAAGNIAFKWDGMDDSSGTLANAGVYKVQANAMIDGKNTALNTNIASKVESVTMANGSNGLQVNLVGLGPVKFSQIKEIM